MRYQTTLNIVVSCIMGIVIQWLSDQRLDRRPEVRGFDPVERSWVPILKELYTGKKHLF